MAEDAILGYLEKNDHISDSGQFAAERRIDHNEIVNVIKSLHGFKYVDAQVLKLTCPRFFFLRHYLNRSNNWDLFKVFLLNSVLFGY